MNREVRMEDGASNYLTLRMERQRDGRWTVYAKHSRVGVGATTTHRDERDATRALHALSYAARKAGWQLRVMSSRGSSDHARMTLDECGERVFHDRRTGQPFKDESSLRPSSAGAVVWSYLLPPRPTDEFGLGTMPAAQAR